MSSTLIPEMVAESFIAAFGANDVEAMRSLLAEDLTAYITNDDGGMDRTDGRDVYLARVEAMPMDDTTYSVELTQDVVAPANDLALVMVEIKAQRGGKALHNFAAHLLRVRDGAVTDWWMVDAKPAGSAEFWAT